MISKVIEEDEIVSLLTQDSYYRKLGSWPLFTSKNVIAKNRGVKIKTNYFSVRESAVDLINMSFDKFQEIIEEYHPYCTELLNKFAGHIVAAGGAVAKNLFTHEYYGSNNVNDIDIFFYDLNVENATRIRKEIIQFLNQKWGDKGKFTVLRNEFVTTIYVTTNGNKGHVYSYQLIHRIYPDVSSIIGGFDLSICMVAYDGKEIYTTPLGTWSIKNQAIIIDTKRRSTSFEYRICKYYNYGFTIIFPGLTQEIINNLIIGPCKTFQNYNDVLGKLKELAAVYNYDIRDILMVNNHKNDLLFNNQQRKENILPFLNINDGNNYLRSDKYVDFDYDSYNKINIGILPYNQKKIENRYINNISDYSHYNIDLNFIPLHNATRLRLNNLTAVVSILNNNIDKEAYNPNIQFAEREIEDYRQRAEKARNYIGNEIEIDDEEKLDYLDNCRLTRCFGKLAPEVKEIRYTNKYNEYVELMIENMKTNAKICQSNLTGIKWITKNPGRQWTASINPIFEDPRQWYGKHYIPVVTGIPEKIETCLRLGRLRSILSNLPEDIFNLVLLHLAKSYADHAWQYIL